MGVRLPAPGMAPRTVRCGLRFSPSSPSVPILRCVANRREAPSDTGCGLQSSLGQAGCPDLTRQEKGHLFPVTGSSADGTNASGVCLWKGSTTAPWCFLFFSFVPVFDRMRRGGVPRPEASFRYRPRRSDTSAPGLCRDWPSLAVSTTREIRFRGS